LTRSSPAASGPADGGLPRLPAGTFLAAALALTLLAAVQAAWLYAFYLGQAGLPQWDMAGHAWGGIELHQALRRGEPLRFLRLLNDQDKWPFGFSLLLLPFLSFGGDGFAAATLLSTALFALTPALLLWAAREVDDSAAGWWGGGLAALLFLASPLLRLFAVLIMREEAGCFFSLLALCCYLRARRRGDERSWRWAGLAGLALFLVKYNYAMIWGITVAASELTCLAPERRGALLRRVGRWLWPWRREAGRAAGRVSRRAAALALYLYVLAALALLRRNPGYPLYAGLLVATGWGLWRAWGWRRDPASRARAAAGWRRLPAAGRALLATVVLPLWIWLLSPRPIHPKQIWTFLHNRETGPPLLSPRALLFYPRAFLDSYQPSPLGAAVLALVALALLARLAGWRPAGGGPYRVVLLAAGLSFLLPTLHPYKEPRFLATAVPFALLAAALFAGRLAHALPLARRRAFAGGALCATAAFVIVGAARHAGLPALLARDYPHYSADPAFALPLDYLAAAAQGSRRLAVLGAFNQLSGNLIRCRLAQLGGAADGTHVGTEVVPPLARFPAGLPPAAADARLRAWLGRERPDRVVALRPLPGSGMLVDEDYRSYNAWQLEALDGLATLAAGSGARLAARQAFPEAGVEVSIYLPGD
jgi:hypothetical protein